MTGSWPVVNGSREHEGRAWQMWSGTPAEANCTASRKVLRIVLSSRAGQAAGHLLGESPIEPEANPDLSICGLMWRYAYVGHASPSWIGSLLGKACVMAKGYHGSDHVRSMVRSVAIVEAGLQQTLGYLAM